MWRLAHCVYRAFRNTAAHRCPQDVLVPLTTIRTTDDDDSIKKEKKKYSCVTKIDLAQILKHNQFTYKNIEKLEEYLKKFSIQLVNKKLDAIEPVKPEKKVEAISSSKETEETLDVLLKSDEACMKTVKNLSDLNDETMSIINLQLALDALEAGNFQLGIETLEACVKTGTNAAALYNLGICYERGIGVEPDRAKACDYYRQASMLGHINAQFNLTLLSNHIDINDNEDDEELTEETLTKKSNSPLRELFFRFNLSSDYKEDLSFDDYQFELKNQSIVCLS